MRPISGRAACSVITHYAPCIAMWLNMGNYRANVGVGAGVGVSAGKLIGNAGGSHELKSGPTINLKATGLFASG